MAPSEARDLDAQKLHAQELHAQEREYWNGDAGLRWVRNQERVDAVLDPVSTALIERAEISEGDKIVDIGCGCGATSLELGLLSGPEGAVLALDISAPMLARARERPPSFFRIAFVLGDAATYGFDRGACDLVFSRFGVMFFGDPAAAFGNIRTALRPGGRLIFACWRDRTLNPWLMVPLQAAYEHVPPLPKPGPEDPGPFSFAEEARVRRILTGAGFAAVTLEPLDLHLDIASAGGIEQAVSFSVEIGATNRAIRDQPAPVVEAVRDSVRRALGPWAQGDRVALPAAVWLVSARNP